jgi:predicted transcriptional regulator
MEAEGLKDKLPENRFTSATTLSEKEFKKGIEKAEKGPFYTVQESMTQFESWLKERKKK